MSSGSTSIALDLVILGGGVAGLWLANRAQQEGYSVAILDSGPLGGAQTLASQGMIHGGMKYTLAGAFTGASEAIADMPRHWRACLCGEGDVDLRHTRILSDHFFMWSGDNLGSKVASFFASKITRGRVDPVSAERRPPLLRHPLFKGSLYRLEDLVLDVPSLVANLANNLDGRCFTLDWSNARFKQDPQGMWDLVLNQDDHQTLIKPKHLVLCAGKGNAELLAKLGLTQPAMQLRPLQQVMVKHHHPFDFYGHCLGMDPTPRLTISSHRLLDGSHVWYLGGSLAEKGATLAATDLIALAEQELRALIPWINLEGAEWATLSIDRAEPLQPNFGRPDNAFVQPITGTNLIVGWPTKLTLAPNFANQVMGILQQGGAVPNQSKHSCESQLAALLPPAVLGKTPWDLAFPPALSPEERMTQRLELLEDDESETSTSLKGRNQ